VVNGEMSLRRLKLSIYEVVTPREEEKVRHCGHYLLAVLTTFKGYHTPHLI
jgi:hypothetical protein